VVVTYIQKGYEMGTVTINAKIDRNTKDEAKSVLNSLGLNMSEAINLFFRQVIFTQSIPFELKLPARETLEAINELESGGGETFATTKDLFESLKK
jgi:DNA-damage-inducible protein J